MHEWTVNELWAKTRLRCEAGHEWTGIPSDDECHMCVCLTDSARLNRRIIDMFEGPDASP